MRSMGWLVLLVLVIPLAVACGGGSGLPSKDGRYSVQGNSVTWDGDQYRFAWADRSGSLHQAHTKDVRLLQDDQTFLQMQNHQGTLHLQQSEPITVLAQDSRGDYTNSWFPFLAGAALGSALSGPRTPTYYYPPTDHFARGDELVGSVTASAPKPPDYSTVQTAPGAVRPAPGAVSGQNSGTGGGNAATNKLSGSSGQAGGAAVIGGQAGGTGSGSAATEKGGFRSGSSSFRSQSGAESAKSSHSSSGSSHLGGSSSGKGISGAGAGHSAPSHSAPSHSFSGGHSSGHR